MDKNEFLTAIAARPYDRALRLTFADWLEERGDVLADLWRGDVLRTLIFDAESGFANDFKDPKRDELRALDGDEFSDGVGYGYAGDGAGDGPMYGGGLDHVLPTWGEPELEPGDGCDWQVSASTHSSGRPWNFN